MFAIERRDAARDVAHIVNRTKAMRCVAMRCDALRRVM